ncbi:MAG: hypothetical protein ACLRIL_07935 [Fusicatenibacter saccharivorans]
MQDRFPLRMRAVTVENGIGILEALRAGCHAAQVIAVDVEEFLLDPLEIPVESSLLLHSQMESRLLSVFMVKQRFPFVCVTVTS